MYYPYECILIVWLHFFFTKKPHKLKKVFYNTPLFVCIVQVVNHKINSVKILIGIVYITPIFTSHKSPIGQNDTTPLKMNAHLKNKKIIFKHWKN